MIKYTNMDEQKDMIIEGLKSSLKKFPEAKDFSELCKLAGQNIRLTENRQNQPSGVM